MNTYNITVCFDLESSRLYENVKAESKHWACVDCIEAYRKEYVVPEDHLLWAYGELVEGEPVYGE